MTLTATAPAPSRPTAADAPPTPRRLLEFPRPSSVTPSQARAWARRVLLAQGVVHAAVDRVAVTVTELVTNACLYGPSDCPVTVSLRPVSAGIEVAVHDQGRIPPEQWAAPGAEAEHGRGLVIVRAMALSFDVQIHSCGGKTVTAVIA